MRVIFIVQIDNDTPTNNTNMNINDITEEDIEMAIHNRLQRNEIKNSDVLVTKPNEEYILGKGLLIPSKNTSSSRKIMEYNQVKQSELCLKPEPISSGIQQGAPIAKLKWIKLCSTCTHHGRWNNKSGSQCWASDCDNYSNWSPDQNAFNKYLNELIGINYFQTN
jgi:hypothetical protein